MRAWLYEVLERNYEWDEVNCCPIAARADSTRRPHLLATTGISGYKKRFTGLEGILRRASNYAAQARAVASACSLGKDPSDIRGNVTSTRVSRPGSSFMNERPQCWLEPGSKSIFTLS
jgi:hypothetical protein